MVKILDMKWFVIVSEKCFSNTRYCTKCVPPKLVSYEHVIKDYTRKVKEKHLKKFLLNIEPSKLGG